MNDSPKFNTLTIDAPLMQKVTDEIKKILDRPLPIEAISQHPTKRYLSSIKSIYITERLNEAFGVGSWTFKSKIINENEGAPVVYVTLKIPKYGIKLSQYGGNDNGGTKNPSYDLGDAYKGAMTDGISKIASYLGIGADVYKGKQKATNGNTNSYKDNGKKWLNESDVKEWQNAERKVSMGLIEPKDLKNHYKVNKANMAHFERIKEDSMNR